jgi:hypothetical protein
MVNMAVLLCFSRDYRFKGLGYERVVAHVLDNAGAVPARRRLQMKYRKPLYIIIIVIDSRTGCWFSSVTASKNVCAGPTQIRDKFGHSQHASPHAFSFALKPAE